MKSAAVSAMTRAFVRDAFVFVHAGMEIGSMLRCMLGVLIAFGAAVALGAPERAPVTALGAFICGFVSLEGIYRTRLIAITLTAVGLAAASFVGELVEPSVPLLVAVMMLIGYAGGVLALLSRRAGAISLYSIVTFIVFSHVPLSRLAALEQALEIFGGAAVQIALFVLFAPLSRFAMERNALARSFAELRAFTSLPVEQLVSVPAVDTLVAARQILGDPQPFARAADIARFRRLLRGIQTLRNRVAGVRMLAQHCRTEQEPARATLLQAIIEQFDRIIALLRHERAELDEKASDERLRQAVAGFETAFIGEITALATARSVVTITRDALQGAAIIAEGKFRPFLLVATPRPDAYLPRRVKWFPREALRLSLVLGVATALGHTIFVRERGYWIALTAALILKPDVRTTVVRGISRIGGTLIGAVMTLIFFALQPTALAVNLLLGFTAATCYLTFFANYAVFSIFVTAFVMCFLRLIGVPTDESIPPRVLDTLIGGALAMLGYLLLPTWVHAQTREVLAALIDAQREFAVRLLSAYASGRVADYGALESLRTRAFQLRGSAEMLIDRTRFEPERTHSISPNLALEILAATQSFALISLAAESAVDVARDHAARPHIDRFVNALDDAMRAVAATLRGQPQPFSDLLHPAYNDLDTALPVDEFDRFLRLHARGYLQSVDLLRELCAAK